MSQPTRLALAGIYAFGLCILSYILLDAFIPPLSAAGAWFYAALALLLLALALQEPFFSTPSHCVANSSAALLSAVSLPTILATPGHLSASSVDQGRYAVAIFSGAMLSIGVGAVATKDRAAGRLAISPQLTSIARRLGNARVVFSVLFFLYVYTCYGREPQIVGSLSAAWLLIVVVRPLEHLVPWAMAGRPIQRPAVGDVSGIRFPGQIEARIRANAPPVRVGDVFHATGSDADLVVLDSAQSSGVHWALLGHSQGDSPSIGADLVPADGERNAVLGPVEPGSDLIHIVVRAPASIRTVEEGSLLEVPIRGARVLYQVTNAKAATESVMSDAQQRYLQVSATKIGRWNEDRQRIESVEWLPTPGALVDVRDRTEDSPHVSAGIGTIVGSGFPIAMDPHRLVTHNTAVLGILGVGKTFLVFELIRRLLAEGIKVVVVDITDQYAPHFREVLPQWYEDASYAAIHAGSVSAYGNVSQHVPLGGNVNQFRIALRADLDAYFAGPERLKIYNPERFTVNRQDSKPFSGNASMVDLTGAEITRVIAEELLDIARASIIDQAKVCLVLEEAHSLIPEWNSTSYEADRSASNGTARAILQGRKYGLGTLIVTQRTANVTKTVLNQCHTVFAMRSFDATSSEFLKNYIGEQYASVLSALGDRRAVVFGRASSCPSPVIVQLNDHDEMVAGFWNPVSSSIPLPAPTPPPTPGP